MGDRTVVLPEAIDQVVGKLRDRCDWLGGVADAVWRGGFSRRGGEWERIVVFGVEENRPKCFGSVVHVTTDLRCGAAETSTECTQRSAWAITGLFPFRNLYGNA